MLKAFWETRVFLYHIIEALRDHERWSQEAYPETWTCIGHWYWHPLRQGYLRLAGRWPIGLELLWSPRESKGCCSVITRMLLLLLMWSLVEIHFYSSSTQHMLWAAYSQTSTTSTLHCSGNSRHLWQHLKQRDFFQLWKCTSCNSLSVQSSLWKSPFLDDPTGISGLQVELPSYLVKVAGVSPDFNCMEWWQRNSRDLPNWQMLLQKCCSSSLCLPPQNRSFSPVLQLWW